MKSTTGSVDDFDQTIITCTSGATLHEEVGAATCSLEECSSTDAITQGQFVNSGHRGCDAANGQITVESNDAPSRQSCVVGVAVEEHQGTQVCNSINCCRVVEVEVHLSGGSPASRGVDVDDISGSKIRI